jgi:fused signal recognition particle receptor
MWASIRERLFGKRPAEETPTETDRSSSSSPKTATPKTAASGAESPYTEGFLGRKIGEATLDDVLDDLELALLQSDVALPVVERIRRDLRRELADKKIKLGTDAESAIRGSFERSVRSILTKPGLDLPATIRAHSPKPYTVLFVGVNGTGKTTTVAKLAHWLGGQKLGVVIAAGDTFRAGAIEQLLVHGERIGIKVVRQHTNINLIEEAKKIRRVVHPDLTIFVGDALTGNDVVEQARLFQKELGVDGLILNKLDADVKGGAALSATFVTGKPIFFVGIGQGYSDFRPFEAEWMVGRLFAEAAS